MIPISENLARMLNDQAARELGNSLLYRHIASYAHTRGLGNIERFFLGEAKGEMDHRDRIVGILDNANVQVSTPDIPAKPSTFNGFPQVSSLYVAAEAETTDYLELLYHAAEEEGCYGVSNVVQGLLEEQIEEEGLTDRVSQMVAASGGNDLLLDLAFAKGQ